MGKAETAAQFCKPTAGLEAASNVTDGQSRSALLSSKYVLMQGGVPLFVNGLCCGAGGAQMFKEPEKGNKDINIERTEEALSLNPDTIARHLAANSRPEGRH